MSKLSHDVIVCFKQCKVVTFLQSFFLVIKACRRLPNLEGLERKYCIFLEQDLTWICDARLVSPL